MTLRIPWRGVRVYALTALAGFAIGWLLVVWLFLPAEEARDSVMVPSLIGHSLEEARLILDSAGLRFALGEERPSADVPPNAVLSQSPLPGTSLPRLSVVRLDASSGPRRVRVPSVSGLTIATARQILGDSGLTVAASREEPSNAPRGEVLRTRPDAGRWVGERAAVEIIVSAGPAQLTMPDLIGRDPTDAIGLLRQLGLTRIRVDSSEGGIAFNIVVGQSPAAGSGIQRNSPVVLRVGGGGGPQRP